MVDILQQNILQQITKLLNINCQVVNCYYANPMEGLFYLFFLPTVLCIVFIYILTDAVIGGSLNRGLKLLVGIAIYIFIIIEGWFTALVSLGYIWIALVIIIGFFWFIWKHFKGGGGGRTGGLASIGGSFTEPFREVVRKKKELLKYNWRKAIRGKPGEEKYVKSVMGILEDAVNGLSQYDKGSLAYAEARDWCTGFAAKTVDVAISAFEQEHGTEAADKYRNERDKIMKKIPS